MKPATTQQCYKVLQHLKHVSLNEQALADFASTIVASELQSASFAIKNKTREQAAELIFVFNVINFCYWAEKGADKWSISLGGEKLDGSAALWRRLDDFQTQTGTLRDLAQKIKLKQALQGNVEIPLLEERVSNLKNYFEVLENQFGSSTTELTKAGRGCAVKLLNVLVNNFPSYSDHSEYMGRRIYYWKRAQLCVKTWHDYLVSQEEKGLMNLHKLTAFADYKVPQLLRHLGVLGYSYELAKLVDGYKLIEKDSNFENEIRIATIIAVDKIASFAGILACDVDNLLWLRAAANADPMLPYHRTYTSAY